MGENKILMFGQQRITILFLLLTWMIIVAQNKFNPPPAEVRAIEFLQREVPAWKTNNGCYSCHNNGDAARALIFAHHRGIKIPENTLTDTIAWLNSPARWDQDKGDPGFSDKRLANVQFATALRAATETGFIKDQQPLQQAARKLTKDQHTDGSWPIDTGTTVGSPATWGTPLATLLSLRVLKAASLPEFQGACQRAEQWLHQLKPTNLLTTATLLSFLIETHKDQRQQKELLNQIRRAQTNDGGWGPYADAPPECFDTAMVLLALAPIRDQVEWAGVIQKGRHFLVSQQNTDGSWPATTRPSGSDSYAQMMSTTGWATIALLATGK